MGVVLELWRNRGECDLSRVRKGEMLSYVSSEKRVTVMKLVLGNTYSLIYLRNARVLRL